MVVNTLIAIILTSYLLSNAAVLDKLFSDDKKTEVKVTFLLWIFFCILIAIFVLTKLFFTKVLFEINYLIFMGILIIICVIQHFVENRNQ